MIKRSCLFIALTLLQALLLTGCGGEEAEFVEDTSQAVRDIDVDLAGMNSTMMIAMINNIYSNPDDYIGNIVKMKGQYFVNYDPESKNLFHFIIFFDETACCNYGFEFRLTDDSTFADDFPKNDTTIELEGKFLKYNDQSGTWYYLEADNFTVLQ